MTFEILESTEKSFHEYLYSLSEQLGIPQKQIRIDLMSGVDTPCYTIALEAWKRGLDYKGETFKLLRQFLYLDESIGYGCRVNVGKYWHLRSLEGTGQLWSQKEELKKMIEKVNTLLSEATEKNFI